jgi:hypothetical protein
MRCDHEQDDGAYVLGALSPAERTAYERHLATCSFCREAVADIAVLPGLLGRLDPADLAAIMEPERPLQRDRMPELVVAARDTRQRDRQRGRWRTLGVALAAACLALVAGVGAVAWLDRGAGRVGGTSPNGTTQLPSVAMRPVDDAVPVSAKVNLTGTSWGTKVDMTCSYASAGDAGKAYTFRLVAYGPDDASEQVGSWTAAPGAEVTMSGVTRFAGSALSRLALIRYDGKTLLTYDVP